MSVFKIYYTTGHCYNFIMTNDSILCMYQKKWAIYICVQTSLNDLYFFSRMWLQIIKMGFLTEATSKHYTKNYLIVKSTHNKTSKPDTLCENTPSM